MHIEKLTFLDFVQTWFEVGSILLQYNVDSEKKLTPKTGQVNYQLDVRVSQVIFNDIIMVGQVSQKKCSFN